MTVSISGTNGVTFPDSSLQAAAASPYVLKNRIINGDMRIDQRNAGASGSAGGYTVDRWAYFQTQSSKGTWQQNAGSVTPPAGFTNYLGFTSSSAYSVVAGDIFMFRQFIEGLNTADLAWGTVNAKTITFSFWVRSSLTGTFGGSLLNSAENRAYPFSYTISSANTWEQKTITIAGDTTGTWLTTNGVGIEVVFGLGVGSTYSGTANAWTGSQFFSATGATSVVGTNGATFYITGVQLEIGSTATPFERRLYGQELINCQRYYQMVRGDGGAYSYFGNGKGYGTSIVQIVIPLQAQMRVPPTGIDIPALSNFFVETGSTIITGLTSIATTSNTNTRNTLWIDCTKSAAFTSGAFFFLLANNTTNAYIGCTAEL